MDKNWQSTININYELRVPHSGDNDTLNNRYLSEECFRDHISNCSSDFPQNNNKPIVNCKGSVKAQFSNMGINLNISNSKSTVFLPDSSGGYCVYSSLQKHERKLHWAVNEQRLGYSHYRSNINKQIFHLSNWKRGASSWMAELVNSTNLKHSSNKNEACTSKAPKVVCNPSSFAKQILDLRSNKASSTSSYPRVENEVETTQMNDFHPISEQYEMKVSELKLA